MKGMFDSVTVNGTTIDRSMPVSDITGLRHSTFWPRTKPNTVILISLIRTMTYRGRAMSLLADDEREFGTRLGGKPKTARLDLRFSAVHGEDIRARLDVDNECAVGQSDVIV
jgi:hypothetical protein